LIPEHYKKFWKIILFVIALPASLVLFTLIFVVTIVLYIPSLGYSWNLFIKLMKWYETIVWKNDERCFGIKVSW